MMVMKGDSDMETLHGFIDHHCLFLDPLKHN